MILIKNNAPALISATSLHSEDYVKKFTSLCSFTNALSSEYSLSFKYDSVKKSPDPLNALRGYMQEIMLRGPQLDVQTLLYHVDNVNSFPSQMRDQIVQEIDEAIENAKRVRRPRDSGFDFVSDLARIINDCSSPCNYFKPVSDIFGFSSQSLQMNSYNVSPPWDANSTLLHAPLNIASNTYNKISTTAQQILIGVATATKNIYSQGIKPLMTEARIATETNLVTQGQSIGFTPHSYYLATDPYPFFQTQNNASNILARARSSLRDCSRVSEFRYRYNPHDPEMNLAVSAPIIVSTNTEGTLVAVDGYGKPIIPDVKPAKLSIKNALDYKESIYDVDDEENWNIYPRTGQQVSENDTAPDAPPQSNTPTNVRGSKVTDYGQSTDPYLDSNTAKGIGILGIGENNTPPPGLQGGNYLLKDYSMAVSPDVEAQMRANNIKPGDWVQVTTSTGNTLTKRWDDRTANYLTGRVDFYTPVGRAPQLDAKIITITKADGPPAGFIQPPRYVNGQPAGLQ